MSSAPGTPDTGFPSSRTATVDRLRHQRVALTRGLYFFLKKAQVSGSPSAPASWGPLTVVVPPLPTRFAWTMRGDAPRWVTTTFRSLPRRPSPLSAELIRPTEYFRFQCSYGEPASASYGSSTPRRYGIAGWPNPSDENSLFSVWPPEVEK